MDCDDRVGPRPTHSAQSVLSELDHIRVRATETKHELDEPPSTPEPELPISATKPQATAATREGKVWKAPASKGEESWADSSDRMSDFQVGEQVEYYSRSFSMWIECTVTWIWPNGKLKLEHPVGW